MRKLGTDESKPWQVGAYLLGVTYERHYPWRKDVSPLWATTTEAWAMLALFGIVVDHRHDLQRSLRGLMGED